jgi:hypothetical protein
MPDVRSVDQGALFKASNLKTVWEFGQEHTAAYVFVSSCRMAQTSFGVKRTVKATSAVEQPTARAEEGISKTFNFFESRRVEFAANLWNVRSARMSHAAYRPRVRLSPM